MMVMYALEYAECSAWFGTQKARHCLSHFSVMEVDDAANRNAGGNEESNRKLQTREMAKQK